MRHLDKTIPCPGRVHFSGVNRECSNAFSTSSSHGVGVPENQQQYIPTTCQRTCELFMANQYIAILSKRLFENVKELVQAFVPGNGMTSVVYAPISASFDWKYRVERLERL